MITEIAVRGLKNWRDGFSLPSLGAKQIVVGPNGSGKSAVIEAMLFGLLGWIPGYGRDTHRSRELITSGQSSMDVELGLDDGRRIRRTLSLGDRGTVSRYFDTSEDGGITWTRGEPDEVPTGHPVELLSLPEFIAMTARERARFLFSKARSVPGGIPITAKSVRAETLAAAQSFWIIASAKKKLSPGSAAPNESDQAMMSKLLDGTLADNADPGQVVEWIGRMLDNTLPERASKLRADTKRVKGEKESLAREVASIAGIPNVSADGVESMSKALAEAEAVLDGLRHQRATVDASASQRDRLTAKIASVRATIAKLPERNRANLEHDTTQWQADITAGEASLQQHEEALKCEITILDQRVAELTTARNLSATAEDALAAAERDEQTAASPRITDEEFDVFERLREAYEVACEARRLNGSEVSADREVSRMASELAGHWKAERDAVSQTKRFASEAVLAAQESAAEADTKMQAAQAEHDEQRQITQNVSNGVTAMRKDLDERRAVAKRAADALETFNKLDQSLVEAERDLAELSKTLAGVNPDYIHDQFQAAEQNVLALRDRRQKAVDALNASQRLERSKLAFDACEREMLALQSVEKALQQVRTNALTWMVAPLTDCLAAYLGAAKQQWKASVLLSDDSGAPSVDFRFDTPNGQGVLFDALSEGQRAFVSAGILSGLAALCGEPNLTVMLETSPCDEAMLSAMMAGIEAMISRSPGIQFVLSRWGGADGSTADIAATFGWQVIDTRMLAGEEASKNAPQ